MPGSGKSTWAKQYQRQNPNVEIVSSDDIREKLNGNAADQSNPKLVWAEYLKEIIAHEKGENVTVIGDSTNLTNHFRSYYAKEAKAHYDKLILIMFDVPYDVCLSRNLSRTERVVPVQAMETLKKEYEPLNEEAAAHYDEIYIVNKDGESTKAK